MDEMIRSSEPDRWGIEREQFRQEEEARKKHTKELKILRTHHLRDLAMLKKMNGRKESNV